MDVSFSGWRREQEGQTGLELRGECFSFLFDRRYTNRLNRMSRVFFEAYAKATSELAASEDRFPSLSEIESKMESGAVYAFKDRLMKNTDFFEEVKISGVSYLVPRASTFHDSSGLYTDLSFDFAAGSVELPSRRKVPLSGLPAGQQPAGEDLQQGELDIQPEVISPSPTDLDQEKDEVVQEVSPAQQQRPEPSVIQPEVGQAEKAGPEGAVVSGTVSIVPQPPEGGVEAQAESKAAVQREEAAFVDLSDAKLPLTGRKASDEGGQPEKAEPPSSIPPRPPVGPAPSAASPVRRGPPWNIILAALGILLLLAVGALMVPGILPFSPVQAEYIHYTTYISNLTAGNITSDFLALEMSNPKGLESELELMLPHGLDRSISARGGVVTINQSDGTTVSLSSSGDSSIRIYLREDLDRIPVVLHLGVPKGYDSTLLVHDPNYEVTRREGMMVLRFNVTNQRTNFEQSFTKD